MFNKSYPSYHSYGDKLKSEGSDGIVRHFRHPVLQVWALTLAEFICLFLIPIISVYNFYVKSTLNEYNNLPSSEQFTTSYTIWIFAPAAFMHVISRFLIFLSLTFTSASSYQMLWCANLIFTCVFSRIFLHKTLSFVKWFAVFLIVGKFTFFFYCHVPQSNFNLFFSWRHNRWSFRWKRKYRKKSSTWRYIDNHWHALLGRTINVRRKVHQKAQRFANSSLRIGRIFWLSYDDVASDNILLCSDSVWHGTASKRVWRCNRRIYSTQKLSCTFDYIHQ